MIGVFLQKVKWSGQHSLRAGWRGYHMLTVLGGGKMGKVEKEYIDIAEAMKKWIIGKLLWREENEGGLEY